MLLISSLFFYDDDDDNDAFLHLCIQVAFLDEKREYVKVDQVEEKRRRCVSP
jgi:hypothetical protein